MKGLIEVWRKVYCIVIPATATISYMILSSVISVDLFNSRNLPDCLTAVITFITIIISLLSVLLTMLVTAKEKSGLIKYFLNSIDKNAFVGGIGYQILTGLISVVCSIILFLNDVLDRFFLSCLLIFTIFVLSSFITLTYRFTKILLKLLINDIDPKERPAKEAKDEDLEEVKKLINKQ